MTTINRPYESTATMEMKQLRTFATIVDLESFTQAGRRLNLSQPAISQQISALERELGVKLLVRAGNRVRPTAAGEVLLQYGRHILLKVDEARRALTDHDTDGAGLLRVGAGGAACHYLLPAVLKELRDRFPRCALHVVSGPTPRTLERLQDGDLDIGLVSLPVQQPRLRVVELCRDELVAIAAPSHPWAERKRVLPEDFAEQPLLIYDRRSQAFQLIERALLEAAAFPRVAMELDDLEAVKEMVRIGLGVAIVARWTVVTEHASGTLAVLTVGKLGLTRPLGLAFLEQNQRPAALKAFVRLCRERLPPLLAP